MVMVPEAASARIRELVTEYLGLPGKTDLHDAVRSTGALPVYRDMGGTLFLRPDGEILARDHDDDGPPVLESDPHWRLTALVVAAEKFPELAVLLPERPLSATTCEACGGSRRVGVAELEQRFFCEKCSGMGWYSPAG